MTNKTCALICAYNEESTIGEIIDRTKPYVNDIIVVNDGSTDKTGSIAKERGVILETHPKNYGKGMALRNGFQQFYNLGCDNLITLDADGQHPPEYIPDFLKTLQEGYDIVIGKRDFSDSCVPTARRIGNTLDSKILSTILKTNIPDPQNGYRLFKKQSAKEIQQGKKGMGFTFELETLIQGVRQNKKIGWQEIPTIYVDGRESKIKPPLHVIDSIGLYLKCLTKKI